MGFIFESFYLLAWSLSPLMSKAEECEKGGTLSPHRAGLIKDWSHMPDNPISIMKLLLVGVRAKILCCSSLATRFQI